MSKITTHQTEFERPDLLKAALDAMNAAYCENAPIPGAYSSVRVDFAIDGSNFGHYRGFGYEYDEKAGRFVLKLDDMDLVHARGDAERGGFAGHAKRVPRPEIAEFETKLHNQYNLALMTEMLAQGQVAMQTTVLEDGTIILEVTDYAYGG